MEVIIILSFFGLFTFVWIKADAYYQDRWYKRELWRIRTIYGRGNPNGMPKRELPNYYPIILSDWRKIKPYTAFTER